MSIDIRTHYLKELRQIFVLFAEMGVEQVRLRFDDTKINILGVDKTKTCLIRANLSNETFTKFESGTLLNFSCCIELNSQFLNFMQIPGSSFSFSGLASDIHNNILTKLTFTTTELCGGNNMSLTINNLPDGPIYNIPNKKFDATVEISTDVPHDILKITNDKYVAIKCNDNKINIGSIYGEPSIYFNEFLNISPHILKPINTRQIVETNFLQLFVKHIKSLSAHVHLFVSDNYPLGVHAYISNFCKIVFFISPVEENLTQSTLNAIIANDDLIQTSPKIIELDMHVLKTMTSCLKADTGIVTIKITDDKYIIDMISDDFKMCLTGTILSSLSENNITVKFNLAHLNNIISKTQSIYNKLELSVAENSPIIIKLRMPSSKYINCVIPVL